MLAKVDPGRESERKKMGTNFQINMIFTARDERKKETSAARVRWQVLKQKRS